MPSNMDGEFLIPDDSAQGDVYQRIERCEKTIRTIRRAVLMRLFLTGVLLYIPFAAEVSVGVVLMLLFVAAINASGLLPLVSQWKGKKKELDQLLDEE